MIKHVTEVRDDRLVAPTSHMMKTPERLMEQLWSMVKLLGPPSVCLLAPTWSRGFHHLPAQLYLLYAHLDFGRLRLAADANRLNKLIHKTSDIVGMELSDRRRLQSFTGAHSCLWPSNSAAPLSFRNWVKRLNGSCPTLCNDTIVIIIIIIITQLLMKYTRILTFC